MRGLAAITVLAALTAPAAAAPTITIKSRTAVELEPVRRSPEGIIVRGRVVERAAKRGVAAPIVQIFLDDQDVRWATGDEDGRFSQTFPVTEGVHDLRVLYAGDFTHSGSSRELLGFDVTKDPVTLVLRAPAEVVLGGPELRVNVRASSLGEPVAITAELVLDDTPLGSITTGDDGFGEAAIPTERLGEPGRRALEVRFLGSSAYDIAAARRELLVVTDTSIAFQLERTALAYDDDVRGAGRLVDAQGAPIPGAPVSLVAAGKSVADVLTDADGQFVLELPAAELGAGDIAVSARYDAVDDWRRDAGSPPVLISIGRPQPVPMRYSIAAFAATAFAVVAFVALRTRPWDPLLARLRRRTTEDDLRAERDDPSAPSALPEVKSGLTLGRPGIVSTLRRANDFGFSGTVRDAVTTRGVAGAELVLVLGGAEHRAECDARGRFELAELAAGQWTAIAAAPGYVTERFAVTVPHRGELRGARVDLMPVRERIFRIYRGVAAPLLPADRWGIWTPRQLVDHVRAARPAPALAAMTDFVEETYFSARTPSEELLDEAEQRARAVATEQADSI